MVAVEPVAGMRDELQRRRPRASRSATASRRTSRSPTQSVDVVTVAQAFHWFRFDEALAEIHRVLVPGGSLAMLFNERDERRRGCETWNEVIGWHSRRIAALPGHATGQRGARRPAASADVAYHRAEWTQPMTRDLLASRVRSMSYVAELDDGRRSRTTSTACSPLVDRTSTSRSTLPYITHV